MQIRSRHPSGFRFRRFAGKLGQGLSACLPGFVAFSGPKVCSWWWYTLGGDPCHQKVVAHGELQPGAQTTHSISRMLPSGTHWVHSWTRKVIIFIKCNEWVVSCSLLLKNPTLEPLCRSRVKSLIYPSWSYKLLFILLCYHARSL